MLRAPALRPLDVVFGLIDPNHPDALGFTCWLPIRETPVRHIRLPVEAVREKEVRSQQSVLLPHPRSERDVPKLQRRWLRAIKRGHRLRGGEGHCDTAVALILPYLGLPTDAVHGTALAKALWPDSNRGIPGWWRAARPMGWLAGAVIREARRLRKANRMRDIVRLERGGVATGVPPEPAPLRVVLGSGPKTQRRRRPRAPVIASLEEIIGGDGTEWEPAAPEKGDDLVQDAERAAAIERIRAAIDDPETGLSDMQSTFLLALICLMTSDLQAGPSDVGRLMGLDSRRAMSTYQSGYRKIRKHLAK